MKKIVGIIAAVAMAASVFAADVSAQVKLGGSLFKYDGTNVTALNISNAATADYAKALGLSANSDNAGAAFDLWFDSTDDKLKSENWNIWFKPFDMLKVVVGNYGTNLNQEQIDWWRSDSGSTGGQGFAFELYPADGISFTLALLPGWGNNWFEGNAVKDMYVKFDYSADFGKINVMLNAAKNFKDLKFGAGYANTFDGISMFVNVLGYANGGFNKIRIEPFAKGNVDAFGWAVFAPVDINLGDKVTAAVGTIAKINYAIGAVNAYLYINEGNWLDFSSINIKPGVTGSVGIMGWEVAADMNIGKAFTLNIPVSFSVNF